MRRDKKKSAGFNLPYSEKIRVPTTQAQREKMKEYAATASGQRAKGREAERAKIRLEMSTLNEKYYDVLVRLAILEHKINTFD